MTPFVPQPVPQLLHDLIYQSAYRMPQRQALAHDGDVLTYDVLASQVKVAADAWLGAGLARGERVAVYLEKREEAVVAMFGAAAAGLVFVPVNPVLKTAQVVHILRDCNVRLLVTSPERLATLAMDGELAKCPDLHTVVLAGLLAGVGPVEGVRLLGWQAAMQGSSPRAPHAVIDADMVAILYTSGSTGRPKGVVLSHRNLVAGALSVSAYLHNVPDDRILCVLPLSFDYGLSQLTTAFAVGACAVLQNHLLVRDIIETVARERITGLAAVPPLWIQLARSDGTTPVTCATSPTRAASCSAAPCRRCKRRCRAPACT